jgi:hypothetical protein
MEFLGVSVANMSARTNLMNEIAYNKVSAGAWRRLEQAARVQAA